MDEMKQPENPEMSLEQKVDALTVTMRDGFKSIDKRFAGIDKRFAGIDERFADVDAAFVEQRQYTEFAFAKLEAQMNDRFDTQDGRLARIERKLDHFIDKLP